MKQERLWTKNFVVLSLINFLLTLIFFLLNSIIALYAIDQFHVSTGMGGKKKKKSNGFHWSEANAC